MLMSTFLNLLFGSERIVRLNIGAYCRYTPFVFIPFI